jgi:aspartyl-tRNA(Asn)/glutamyl-tRNA(Gln) amidotransferase subunit B
MSKGVLRFEANVSVMHKDDKEFRQRTEIKNLNTIRGMVRAIDAEVQRQIRLYEKGETIKPATLGWDEANSKIIIQRYKERPDEYRYFPEPDLPIVEMSREWVEQVRSGLPELPDTRRARYVALGLTPYDAKVLTLDRATAAFYEGVLATGVSAKVAANWITGSLFSLFNEKKVDRETINETKITAAKFAGLIRLVEAGTINAQTAKDVLVVLWETGDEPAAIVESRGLAQVSDTSVIAEKVAAALAANEAMVTRYLNGEEKVFNALFGSVMKDLKGKGAPDTIRQVLQEQLNEKKG